MDRIVTSYLNSVYTINENSVCYFKHTRYNITYIDLLREIEYFFNLNGIDSKVYIEKWVDNIYPEFDLSKYMMNSWGSLNRNGRVYLRDVMFRALNDYNSSNDNQSVILYL